MAMLDEALVEKALEGDRNAFGLLVRKYQRPTCALIRHLTRDAVAADEVTQDVFVDAYQKLGQLKDARRFGGWLRSIAMSHCRMWWRRQKRDAKNVPLVEDSGKAEAREQESPAQDNETPLGIDSMIRRLPAKLQTAALLCFEKNLSPSAASSILGLKPGTLRKRLHMARSKLQRRIVERAEQEFRMHLLPNDFAERCICRCAKSRRLKSDTGGAQLNKKDNCGCGCGGNAAKSPPKEKRSSKKKSRK